MMPLDPGILFLNIHGNNTVSLHQTGDGKMRGLGGSVCFDAVSRPGRAIRPPPTGMGCSKHHPAFRPGIRYPESR